MACGRTMILALLPFAIAGCHASSEPDPHAPQIPLTGNPLSKVIERLGDPDEVAEGQYFGTKFSAGPIAAVLKYSKDQLYVYISDKGIVLGVAKGSTKNFIRY